MSEVQTRPAAPRGRGSIRGGRGAFSTRGGRGGSRAGHAPNGDNAPVTSIEEEEDGEIAQLKKKYGSKVDTIKEVFPGWTNEDAVLALQENDGDLDLTFDQISTGRFYNIYTVLELTTIQALSLHGVQFRRTRKINQNPNPKTLPLLLLSQKLATPALHEVDEVVSKALVEAVAVELIEVGAVAEVAVEHL